MIQDASSRSLVAEPRWQPASDFLSVPFKVGSSGRVSLTDKSPSGHD
jgi:hypothetical protein